MEAQLVRARRFNRCLIACIVLSLGGWFISKSFDPETVLAQSGVKEIRANSFFLEDANGKVRASLLVTEAGPGLLLSDGNGKLRAALRVTKDGPGLALADENGKPRVGLRVNKDGPRLQQLGENGNVNAVMAVFKDAPGLGLADENGKVIWSAP